MSRISGHQLGEAKSHQIQEMNDADGAASRAIAITDLKYQSENIEQIDNLDDRDGIFLGLSSAFPAASVSIGQEVKSVTRTEYLVRYAFLQNRFC